MGTSQDYLVAVQEGATIIRLGRSLYFAQARIITAGKSPAEANLHTIMAFRDTWHRTLVYFGLADDAAYEEDIEPYPEPEVDMQDSYRERPHRAPAPAPATRRVRRHLRRRRRPPHERAAASAARPNGRGSGGDVRVHFVAPKNFNDVQDVADKFKDTIPVILNLQAADTDLSKRLIDFASGLTYALDGGMQRIADKVFLLTPQNVEVSAEQRARCWRRASSTSLERRRPW